ncbi:hypothetical protein ABWH92_12425 [Ahrensia marina]|uniref:DUF6950 family protein n=1 Tax=Ahrensia marina TaxID=1514904 RepID=UPI0035CF953C
MADLRLEDRLYAYLRDLRAEAKPFDYGQFDCGRFVFRWVGECGGPSIEPPYQSVEEAADYLEDLAHNHIAEIERAGWTPTDEPICGAVVMINFRGFPMFGIMGAEGLAIFVAHNGYREARVTPVKAWNPCPLLQLP